MELQEARRRVLSQVNSLDSQGCLPYDGAGITAYTAFFQDVEPNLAAQAIWSLIDDGTLVIDQHTDMVGYPNG